MKNSLLLVWAFFFGVVFTCLFGPFWKSIAFHRFPTKEESIRVARESISRCLNRVDLSNFAVFHDCYGRPIDKSVLIDAKNTSELSYNSVLFQYQDKSALVIARSPLDDLLLYDTRSGQKLTLESNRPGARPWTLFNYP